MKPSPSSEYDEQDEKIIKLLKDLGSSSSAYPSELLAARRAAFLADVERLSTPAIGEELSVGEQEIVKLLGNLKFVQPEYPPDLLAARRSAFLRQMRSAGGTRLLDKLRASLQRRFSSKIAAPSLPPASLMRFSLVIGSLIAAVFLGSLVFSRMEQTFQPSPSQAAVETPHFLPTRTGEVAILICKPDGQTSSCPPGELDRSQDLADQGNGVAQPAVSKDAPSNPHAVYKAAYVNDGRLGTSWVSNSIDSWIKIDLGQVRTINTISLQNGSPDSAKDNNPGQFVIAVALSDVYTDGDSRNDYLEYAQVFHSEQTGFSGTVSHAETIRTQFPSVKARFVKITFEKAGAAIDEVGVFMVQPPVLAQKPTRTPQDDLPGITQTAIHTNTSLPTDTATSLPTGTAGSTDTATPTPTYTPSPSDTPTALPTDTLPPENTSTPADLSPSDTPIPLPTIAAVTVMPGTVVVTDHDQTLTFICNGDAVEIRGHANTVTLLGSCSSITVTGNRNRVFWESGFPLITIKGKDNIVEQL